MNLEQILTDLQEKSWSFTPNALSSNELRLLNAFINSHRSEFRPAMVGKASGKVRREDIRGDVTYWLGEETAPAEIQTIFASIGKLREALNRRFFLGLKDFEAHLAIYPPGTFYKEHLDRHEDESSRTLSFIFYLHEEWKEGDGGELRINYQGKEKLIEPLPGAFMCFLSAEIPHEVTLTHRERRSLTGWIHNKRLL